MSWPKASRPTWRRTTTLARPEARPLFQNLKAFKAAREQIDEIARVHIKGDVKKIQWVGKNLEMSVGSALDGQPAASLDALYEVAVALASVQLEQIMTAACPDGVKR